MTLLELPAALSPSKVAAFRKCALQFRFSSIDRLPEPSSPAATKGTVVHRALERLFCHEPPGARTVEAALAQLALATPEVLTDAENADLEMSDDEWAEFHADTEALVRRYFELEDPNGVNAIGFELKLEAQVGNLRLRGIIDRLDLDEDGGLVVTDYKTGKAPSETFERDSLGGVQFYAYLCEQNFGVRPSRIQLLHLREPVAISAVPSDQSIKGLTQRASAIWTAVERAYATNDFRPKPSRLCDWCAFQAYCPEFGGDPALAAVAAEAARAEREAAREAARVVAV